jgi:hypothetical protein
MTANDSTDYGEDAVRVPVSELWEGVLLLSLSAVLSIQFSQSR